MKTERDWHRGRRFACICMGAVWAILFALATPASAQLFGGDGLFNRKEKNRGKLSGTPKDPGIPVPVTGTASVVKGSESAFYIKAGTKTPGQIVEFLIRDFPLAGKIVSVVSDPADRSRAVVTYFAEPGSSANQDAFSFAVRYRGGRYSPSIRYDIDLADTKLSEIEVTEKMDFGKVMIGEEAVREIEVRNNGGAPFARQLMVASPWHIVEPANGKVVLSPRGSKRIKVAFRPTLVGEVNFLLGLSRSKKGLCKLNGEASLPFSILTEEIELTLDPKTRRRKGEVIFQNHGKKPILLAVRGSTRLAKSLGSEVILGAGKETKKEIFLTETDVAGFSGAAEFALENGFSNTVRVSAAAVPGEIRLEVPGALSSEVINFGQVQAGRTTERGFLVKNIGGEAVPLDYEVGNPFRLIASPLKELAPLSAVQVTIEFSPLPGDEGSADVSMKVMTNDQVVPMRLLGNVTKGASSAGFSLSSGKSKTQPDPESSASASVAQNGGGMSPIRIREPVAGAKSGVPINEKVLVAPWLDSELSPEDLEAMRSPQGIPARSLLNRPFNSDVRGAEDLEVVVAGVRDLTLGFTAPPESEFHKFELETIGTVIPNESDQLPVNVWIPVENVDFERIGRLVKAKVQVPLPSTEYQFRVITTNELGKVAFPSEGILATTGLPMDWTWIYVTLGAILLIAMGITLRKIIVDRRPEVYQSQHV